MKSAKIRKLLVRYFVLIYLLIIVVPRLSSARDTYEQKLKKLAAVKALQGAIQELKNFQTDDSKLKRMMLEKPEDYYEEENSKIELGKWYKNEHVKFINDKQKAVYKVFSENGNAFSRNWLSSYLENNLKSSQEDIIKENMYRIFSPAFKKARDQATVEQLSKITLGIYPDPLDVEDIAKVGYSSKVTENLKERMSGTLSLFKENSVILDDKIKDVLDDAIKQFNDQREKLQTSNGGKHRTEEAISKKIKEHIDMLIKQQEKRENRIIYSIFPSIKNSISNRSKELVEKKLTDYINSNEVFSLVDEEYIKSTIKKFPIEHKHLVESQKIFKDDLSDTFKNNVIEVYLQKVKRIDDDVPSFKDWITNFLKKENRGKSLLSPKLNHILNVVIPPVRDKIAEEQLGTYFGEIHTRQWEIPETVIVDYYLTKNNSTDTDKYKRRHSIEMDELPEMLGITNLNFNQKKAVLIEEAINKLKRLLNDDLLNEGNDVISKQVTIIDSYGQDIIDDVRRRYINTKDKNKIAKVLFRTYKNNQRCPVRNLHTGKRLKKQ